MRRHLAACDLYEAAGHTNVPIPIKEVRAMATRIGRATVKDGKVKPVDTTPKHFKVATAKKTARVVKRLKANREARKA